MLILMAVVLLYDRGLGEFICTSMEYGSLETPQGGSVVPPTAYKFSFILFCNSMS